MSDLDDRLAGTRALRRERDDRDRVRLTARLEELARRWEAADGHGPLPASHAARKALATDDLPRARLALHVAERALDLREDAMVSAEEAPPPRAPPASLPASLRVLLDELLETGRPVKALTPEEAGRSAQGASHRDATEPTSRSAHLTPIRARIRLDALRLRLLFDLDRLADQLPTDLRVTLAREAEQASSTDALFELRERLLTALIGHPPGPLTG